MAAVTAKVKCSAKGAGYSDTVGVEFLPDYQDGRNAEWAEATPSLSFKMNVKSAVAEHFEVGGKYTVTFEPTTD